jgi:hypothetical protein
MKTAFSAEHALGVNSRAARKLLSNLLVRGLFEKSERLGEQESMSKSIEIGQAKAQFTNQRIILTSQVIQRVYLLIKRVMSNHLTFLIDTKDQF